MYGSPDSGEQFFPQMSIVAGVGLQDDTFTGPSRLRQNHTITGTCGQTRSLSQGPSSLSLLSILDPNF